MRSLGTKEVLDIYSLPLVVLAIRLPSAEFLIFQLYSVMGDS